RSPEGGETAPQVATQPPGPEPVRSRAGDRSPTARSSRGKSPSGGGRQQCASGPLGSVSLPDGQNKCQCMAFENGPSELEPREPRAGQVVMSLADAELPPAEQFRDLYRLSDPALSELGLDEFLDELLVRVQDALGVDTVAILLYDEESNQLVARAAKGIEEEVERGVRLPIG